ncbi:MAG: A/G-specific adenine glycosylase [Dehalococcoidia bacterium]|nr:A/G-specific adenine glycosylase [Dehalococcoidia bacterium]MDW8119571.1 A/G-specific adenine glycosylase [Chloroflexota bacterium]
MTLTPLQERLLQWHTTHTRSLPWRETRDPYAIVVSEIMLQQTGVERVLPKYKDWLARWPTWEALAQAPLGEVVRAWEPLGYNRRAVWLHRIAQRVVQHWGGRLPQDARALATLPGVGPYTRNAILCFAFGHDVAVLDTNVRRVLARAILGEKDAWPSALREVAEGLVPQGMGRTWNLALMDLGATVCVARLPRCGICPWRDLCAWRARGMPPGSPQRRPAPFPGSPRYFRGRMLAFLRRVPTGQSVPLEDLCVHIGLDTALGYQLAHALHREGLVQVREEKGLYCISLPP